MSQIFKNQLKQIVTQEKQVNPTNQSSNKPGKLYKQTNREIRAHGQDNKLGKMQSDQLTNDVNQRQNRQKQEGQKSKVLSLHSQRNQYEEAGRYVQENIVNKFKEAKNKDLKDYHSKNNEKTIYLDQQKQQHKKNDKQEKSHKSNDSHQIKQQHQSKNEYKPENDDRNGRHKSSKQSRQSSKQMQILSEEPSYKVQYYYEDEQDVKQHYQINYKSKSKSKSRTRSRSVSEERYSKKHKTQQSLIEKDQMNGNNDNNQVKQLEVIKNQSISKYYNNNNQQGSQKRQQKLQKVIDLYENPYDQLYQQPPDYDDKGFKILQPQRIHQTIFIDKDENSAESENMGYTGRPLQISKF